MAHGEMNIKKIRFVHKPHGKTQTVSKFKEQLESKTQMRPASAAFYHSTTLITTLIKHFYACLSLSLSSSDFPHWTLQYLKYVLRKA
jgi:hypothetical protein